MRESGPSAYSSGSRFMSVNEWRDERSGRHRRVGDDLISGAGLHRPEMEWRNGAYRSFY